MTRVEDVSGRAALPLRTPGSIARLIRQSLTTSGPPEKYRLAVNAVTQPLGSSPSLPCGYKNLISHVSAAAV